MSTRQNTRSSMGHWSIALALGVVLSLVVAGIVWFGSASDRRSSARPVIHSSGPTVDSIEALVGASDVVVVGTVTGINSREVDRGGDPEIDPDSGQAIPGMPVMFVGVEVEEVLAGEVSVGAEIHVLRFDTDEVISADESDLGEGDRFILFLSYVSASDTPGITTVDEFYNTVGGDDGVFEIVGETAVARGEVTAVAARDIVTDWDDDQQPPAFRIDVEQLISFVRSAER